MACLRGVGRLCVGMAMAHVELGGGIGTVLLHSTRAVSGAQDGGHALLRTLHATAGAHHGLCTPRQPS